jgi:hypothetical protein
MKTVTFNITTATGGAYTSSTDGGVTGQNSTGNPYKLYRVVWVDGTLADGVDAVLSVTGTPSGVDETLLTLTNANDDAVYYPRYDAHSNAGAALAEGADKTATRVQGIVDGQLKLAVTNGGDAKTGKCLVYLEKC